MPLTGFVAKTLLVPCVFLIATLPIACTTGQHAQHPSGERSTVVHGSVSFAGLYQQVHESVVSIKAIRRGEFSRSEQLTSIRALKEQCARDINDCLASLDELALGSHFGSGVLLDTQGLTLTAAHVVADAESLYLRLAGERTVAAQVLVRDVRNDIALLAPLQPIQTQAARIGDASRLRIGDSIVSIGSPFGLPGTMATGIVSGQDRRIGELDEMPLLQSDVIVNPGNSGGPIFDLDGRVVALTSKLLSSGAGFSGVSFSIPIELAMKVVDDLRKNGYSRRGRMGAVFVDVPPEMVEIRGLADARGALVMAVAADGPFGQHDIRAGDIVKAFNGEVVNHAGALSRRLFEMDSARPILVELLRSGQSVQRSFSN